MTLDQAIAQTWLFSDLMPDEREQLVKRFEEKSVAPSSFLLQEAKPNRGIWIVVEGSFEVLKDSKVVTNLGPGDIFGEQSWLEGLSASASIRVSSPDGGRVGLILFNDFDDYLGFYPEANISILRKLAINLSQRLRQQKT